MLYIESAYKRTYFPLTTLQLFYYSITLLLYCSILFIPFYLFCVTNALIQKKKSLHRGGF